MHVQQTVQSKREAYHFAMRNFRVFVIHAAVLLALASSGHAAAQVLPDLGDSAQAGLSPQLERKVGESIMRDYRRDPDFIDDPEVIAYINSVGQALVSVSVDAGREFEFFVVRDPSINAFAMPGGYVGVHSGLILSAQAESELAGVLAHEVSHVTQRHIARQVDKSDKMQWPMIAAMVAGLLAARSNPQVAQAAIVTSQAGMMQSQLNYSRDFEREADRVGFTLMTPAGFDPTGMAQFFERLQKANRLAESNAPVYLRTHPLSTERMADMQARAADTEYRQRPDSIEFQLVRARLRSETGLPQDAVALFQRQLKEDRYLSKVSAHYGLALARLRTHDPKQALDSLHAAEAIAGPHPMFATLAARIHRERGDLLAARDDITRAVATWGQRSYLVYEQALTLQALGDHLAAVAVLDALLRNHPHDVLAWHMIAQSHAALGHVALQHRAQGEAYALSGSLADAIDQLQSAQRARDGDLYLMAAVDTRLSELKGLYAEERAARR